MIITKKISRLYFEVSFFDQFYPRTFWIFSYSELYWKDKFGTPRVEQVPYISIRIRDRYYQILIGSDSWWEQRIWWKHYCDGNYQKAKDLWKWKDLKNNSTWSL